MIDTKPVSQLVSPWDTSEERLLVGVASQRSLKHKKPSFLELACSLISLRRYLGIFLKHNKQVNYRWFIFRSSFIHDNSFPYFTILGFLLDNLSRLCGLSITIYKSSKIVVKWNQASHLPNIQQLSIIYYL